MTEEAEIKSENTRRDLNNRFGISCPLKNHESQQSMKRVTAWYNPSVLDYLFPPSICATAGLGCGGDMFYEDIEKFRELL